MGMSLRWPWISRRVLGTQGEQGGATTAARASTGQCPAAPPQGTRRMVAGGPSAGGTSQAPSSEVPKFSRGLRGIEQLGPTGGSGLEEELPPHVSQGWLPRVMTARSRWRWDSPAKGKLRWT